MNGYPNWKLISCHICVIALFIIYEQLCTIVFGTGVSTLFRISYYIPGLALFYFIIRIILSFWDRSKLVACCFIFLGIILHSFFFYLIDLWIDSVYEIDFSFKTSITSAIFRSLYITGFGIGYSAVYLNIKKTEEITALKIQSLEYENAVLRSQVQPHQIYNIHNLVYASIKDKFPQEAGALVLCSRLIRNSFAHVDQVGKVPLSNEIETIYTMVELYQLLEENKLHLLLTVEVPENKLGIKVPVSLLSLLVLDVFKHGNISMQNCPAIITLKVSETCLLFFIQNKKQSRDIAPGLNIGLDNVRKRLQYVYRDDYDLKIDETEFDFTLNLEIKI